MSENADKIEAEIARRLEDLEVLGHDDLERLAYAQAHIDGERRSVEDAKRSSDRLDAGMEFVQKTLAAAVAGYAVGRADKAAEGS